MNAKNDTRSERWNPGNPTAAHPAAHADAALPVTGGACRVAWTDPMDTAPGNGEFVDGGLGI